MKSKEKMKEVLKNKARFHMTVTFIITVILFVALLLFGLTRINNIMDAETIGWVEKVTEQNKNILLEQIKLRTEQISNVANVIAESNSLDDAKVHQYISSLDQNNNNMEYAIVYMDGKGYDSRGNEIDLNYLDCIQRALGGENSVTSVERNVLGSEEDVLLIAQPIIKDGTQVGVVTGNCELSVYKTLLRHDVYESQNNTYVVDTKGSILLKDELTQDKTDENQIVDFTDEKQLEKMPVIKQLKQNLEAGKSGVLLYEPEENNKEIYLSYKKLDVNDWYVIDAIPFKLFTPKHDAIKQIIVIIAMATVVLFILLGLILYSSNKKAKQIQEALISFDKVTGIPNRRYLMEFYEKKVKNDNPYAYFLFRVNFFDKIGSVFDYETGSNLLREIAKTAKKEVGQNECAARLSQNYFALLLSFDKEEALTKRIESFLSMLECIELNNGHVVFDYKCSFTAGVVMLQQEQTLDDANGKAYDIVTRLGEHRERKWSYFNEELKAERSLQEELAGDILKAIEEQQFVPFFQPHYNIISNEIQGGEILARWQHPERGILMPSVFLPLLEEAGCILELDMLMLEEACKQIKEWINQGWLPVPLSINFSILNLHRKDFITRVESILQKYNVSPNLISLEFKETTVFANIQKAKGIFGKLKDFGFILAIDGFGSGDASFYIMEEIDVKILKVDRSLIARLEENQKTQVLLAMIIKMAKALDMTVIAEGIETTKQLEYLKSVGCTNAQGFLFGKPSSKTEFGEIIFAEED